jgi:hypothetical protein
VFFNDASAAGTFTVTIDIAGAVCANFDASGITNAARKMTLTGTTSVGLLSVNGSWTNPTSTYFAWTAWTAGGVTFTATGTVTTNAVGFAASFNISGSGITVTLGGAFSQVFGNTGLVNGTFDTSSVSNYSFTTSGTILISANTNTRSLNLNASAISIAVNYTDSSTGGFTLNAGTSTITCSAVSPTFAGGGKTFYDVTFSSTAISSITITGSNTFNNLTFAARAAAGVGVAGLAAGTTQTINGTLTTNSGSSATPERRLLFYSTTITSQATMSVAAVSLTNTDFRDIAASGAASPFTGTSLGNTANNSNITFTTAKTVYWSLLAGGSWNAAAWATSSGGTPAAANFPLAQDTCIIDDSGLTAGNTITYSTNIQIGTIFSSRTAAWTFACAALVPSIYGNFTLDANVTFTGTNVILFISTGGAQTITTNGVPFPAAVTVVGGLFSLADNITMGSTRTFTLTSGTLDLNNKTLSTGIFSSSNSNTRSVAFGTGNITLTGSGTVWSTATSTNFSRTGTPTVNVSNNSASATTVSTSALTEAQALDFNYTTGTYTLTDTAGTYRNLSFSGFSGTVLNAARTIYGNANFAVGPTYNAGAVATTFAATSGTQQITTNSQTLDFSITQNNAGATLQLQDNLTMGSTRTFSLTGGTLDLNTRTATIGTFSSTGSTARVINFNSGTLSISGTTTSAFTASGSNLTTTGTGTITMTAATAKTFAGGGFGYTATLNQGGAGALTISGSNTFYDITATTLPSTITFTSGTTQAVIQFSASGTAGNLLTLNSTSAGSPFTLNKTGGTVNVSYVSITDSTATGATWNSYLTNGNVDGGGNTGWNFTVAPVTAAYLSDIKLRSMAQRGRF